MVLSTKAFVIRTPTKIANINIAFDSLQHLKNGGKLVNEGCVIPTRYTYLPQMYTILNSKQFCG